MGAKLGCSHCARNTNSGLARYVTVIFDTLPDSAATPVLIPTLVGQGVARSRWAPGELGTRSCLDFGTGRRSPDIAEESKAYHSEQFANQIPPLALQ